MWCPACGQEVAASVEHRSSALHCARCGKAHRAATDESASHVDANSETSGASPQHTIRRTRAWSNKREADALGTFFDELHRADRLLKRTDGLLDGFVQCGAVRPALAKSPPARSVRTNTAPLRSRWSTRVSPSERSPFASRTHTGRLLRLLTLLVAAAASACGVILLWGAHRSNDLRQTALALAILLAAQSLWVALVVVGFRCQEKDSLLRGSDRELAVNQKRAPEILERGISAREF